MAYDVIISPTAKEDLKKFDKELQRLFFNKIKNSRNIQKYMESLFVNHYKANGK